MATLKKRDSSPDNKKVIQKQELEKLTKLYPKDAERLRQTAEKLGFPVEWYVRANLWALHLERMGRLVRRKKRGE